jgi:predicted metal-dependent hydrolase
MNKLDEKLKRVLDSYAQAVSDVKRKPLTREKISYGFRINVDAINAESFWAGVEYAENMHGITGGGE